MKILLIDDDQALLTVFETALTQAGYQIIKAMTGQAGIEAAKSQKPDFIFLDQILPDIQGNQVLQTLKNDEATKAIPVSMLSNFGQNELMDQAIKIGAVDYILKYQIEPTDLVAKVKQYIDKPTTEIPETGTAM